MNATLLRLAIVDTRRRGPPSANVTPRSRVGLGAGPARQIFRLFASRQAQCPLHGGGKICFDRLSLDLAAEKNRPPKLAEQRGVLGKTARPPQLAGEATEQSVPQHHDSARGVHTIPPAHP